jgi:hypothetical protein
MGRYIKNTINIMQNWYTQEEYLRLYNQSIIQAQQRAQLEGPFPFFSTSQTVSPGGNPGDTGNENGYVDNYADDYFE